MLVGERDTADYFEKGTLTPPPPAIIWSGSPGTQGASGSDFSTPRDPKIVANWVINELTSKLNKERRPITASPVSASQIAAIIDLIADGTISGKIAKDVFEIVWTEGGDPRAIVEERGLKQVTDIGAIEKIVDDIVAKNPDKVADARSNPKAIGWFVGQVMKASGGKANPQTVNELLRKKIGI